MGKKSAKKSNARGAGSASSRKSPKKEVPVPITAAINQVKEIKSRYAESLPKRPQKALEGIRREIRQTKYPIYNLNRKIKYAPSRYYAGKFQKQKMELEAQLAARLNDLAAKREDFKTLVKDYEIIRKQKIADQRKVKRREKQQYKADENQDYKEFERLAFEILKLKGNIDAASDLLGIPITKIDTSDYIPSEETDEKGYLEDPANPYTVWMAIAKLKEDQKSGFWDYYIINGKRFASDNYVMIDFEAAKFWGSLKKTRTNTPEVDRFFNKKSKTVRYIPHKS